MQHFNLIHRQYDNTANLLNYYFQATGPIEAEAMACELCNLLGVEYVSVVPITIEPQEDFSRCFRLNLARESFFSV